ncbi:aggregation-promoting factor C-terminal-like domain-containing protein [Schumannella luteola]
MGLRAARSAALSGALALVVALGLISPATAADYPSWDDVEAARGNEAATAETIATISALLDGLQAEAARLGDAAVAASAAADTARAELDRATATEASLARRADEAAKAADDSAEQAAQLAAALYRSGGADLTATLLVSSAEASDDLLYRLGALGRAGERVGVALERAEQERNLASSLADQAEVARAERERLSSEADAARAAADAASAAADAAVAEHQARLSVLYEQLASLKNTTVLIEQQYRIGLESNGDGGSGSGTTDGGFSVPGNEVNNVAAAQHFAMVQITASFGWGSEQGPCLIWLWNRESGWRTNAYNASSGAYGIPQALPGSKMANYAADWRTNYETQVMWGLIYINGRYGSPCAAWAHSEAVGWY